MTDNSFRPGYLSDRLVAWRMRTDGPLLVLAIGSLPLLLLDLKRGDLGYADQLFLDTVNAIVLIALLPTTSWNCRWLLIVGSTHCVSGPAPRSSSLRRWRSSQLCLGLVCFAFFAQVECGGA